MSEPMSPEDARDILSRWKAEHQEELDLVTRRLATTNASLVEALRRAEKAEAVIARARALLPEWRAQYGVDGPDGFVHNVAHDCADDLVEALGEECKL